MAPRAGSSHTRPSPPTSRLSEQDTRGAWLEGGRLSRPNRWYVRKPDSRGGVTHAEEVELRAVGPGVDREAGVRFRLLLGRQPFAHLIVIFFSSGSKSAMCASSPCPGIMDIAIVGCLWDSPLEFSTLRACWGVGGGGEDEGQSRRGRSGSGRAGMKVNLHQVAHKDGAPGDTQGPTKQRQALKYTAKGPHDSRCCLR